MQLPPLTATVLRRLLLESLIIDRELHQRDHLRLKTLERRGLAKRSANGDIWRPTDAAHDVDLTNAAPDNYVVIKAIGMMRPFYAVRNGARGLFEAVEHDNGRGWAIRDLKKGDLIGDEHVSDIQAIP
jgi:hypothetical protein